MDDSTPLSSQPLPGKGILGFNMANTFQSPFFWIVVGAAAVLALQYASKKQGQSRPMRNVTGTAE